MNEQPKFSGMWRRLGAYMIDFILIFILFCLLLFVFSFKFYLALLIVFSFNFSVLGWLYFALLESSSLQATIGKWLLQIKVVDEQGNRLSFKRASLRFFSKWLSAMTLWIGFIMIAFSRKKQALHDKVVSTYVVIRN